MHSHALIAAKKSGSGALRPQSTPASTAGGDDDYVGVP